MNKMSLDHKLPTVAELMESTLARFITLAENYCGYQGTTKELTVNWVHSLLPKAYVEASKEDNPNWKQAMNSPFSDKFWQATCTQLETLDGMGAWDVVNSEDDMNATRLTWEFKLN